MSLWKHLEVVLLIGLFCGSRALLAQVPSPQAELTTEEIIGTVLYADGTTPIVGFPVRVWSVDTEKFVYRTSTGDGGGFRIPSMMAGRTFLLVGRVKIDLSIVSNQQDRKQPNDIVIALPSRMLMSGRQILDSTFMMLPLFPLLRMDNQPPTPPRVMSP